MATRIPGFGRAPLVALALAAALVASVPAAACTARVVKVVVPNPAGGGGDLITRVLSERAATELGQSFVIENRAGASTVIGTEFVATSKPDGCTILSLTASGIVISVLRDRMPYSLERDFAPIIGIGSFPMTLSVVGTSPIKSLADLAAAAKQPGGIAYGSGGPGTLAHLSSVRLLRELGGTGNHIPFRGNADAIQALLGGTVQMFFPSTAESIPLSKAGKVRVLGITSDERFPSLPDVPTMKELGFADFTPRLWYGFLAPAGTPPAYVQRLYEAFAKALQDPGVRERLITLGFTPDIQDPATTAAYMKREAARWQAVIRENNIAGTN